MSHEIKIHAAQTSILRELLFMPEAGFADLQRPTGLSSDHFNFHITRLSELGLIEKVSRGNYRLSAKGKEYANRLDTDNNTVERQPKIAVLIALSRERDGQTEYVFQERLKNPYFGFWGMPTGKLRWGESIVEGALRESVEETGLVADFEIVGIYHERVVTEESTEFLEDKIFFMVRGTNIRGTFQAEFEGGRNEWLTVEEVSKKDKLFDSLPEEIRILNKETWLVDRIAERKKADF